MRTNPVRDRLKGGSVAYGIMAAEFFTPGFCQIAANAGAEFVIFDMEHGGVGIDVIKAQIAFARGAGIAPFVRVPTLAYGWVAPVLDAGAMGIMAPMIETRDQAEKLANWCRYRPEGMRGVCFGVAHDPSSANPCDEHENDDYWEELREKRRDVSIFRGEDSIQHTELPCEAPGGGNDQER